MLMHLITLWWIPKPESISGWRQNQTSPEGRSRVLEALGTTWASATSSKSRETTSASWYCWRWCQIYPQWFQNNCNATELPPSGCYANPGLSQTFSFYCTKNMWLLWSFDIENYDNLWVLLSKDWIFHASYSSRWGMSYHWGLRPWILFCVWWHGLAMYLCIYCFVLFLTVLYCFVLYRFSQMFTPRKPEPPGQDLCDQAAYVGKYPSTAPCESQQLDKRQARLAGKSMSHRFALTELRGDWKWHREFWLMKRHYKAKDVCHCCFASIYSGPTQYLMSALIVFSLISCSPHKSIGWRVSATTHNPPQPWYIYIYNFIWSCSILNILSAKVHTIWGHAELSKDDCATMVSLQSEGLCQPTMCFLALNQKVLCW